MYLACENFDKNVVVEDPIPQPCNLCDKMIKNAGIIRVVNRRGEIDGFD